MKDNFLEYANRLKNQSFEGWSEQAIDAYKTAIISLVEFYKVENQVPKGFCYWRKFDEGSMGFRDWAWQTSCGKSYDYDVTKLMKFCPNCGKLTVSSL